MNEGRARAWAVVVCLGAALVLTAPGALGSSDLYVGDVGHFEQPRDELVAARLRAGEGLPRWLPGVFGGAPALGGQELALFYAPNDLLLLVAPGRARVWGLALHLVLAALGARALARRLGAGSGASLVSGLVYGFGGAAVSMNTVLVYARSAGWLPWVVLGLLRASGALRSERDSPGERARGLAVGVLALLGTYLGGDPLGCGFAALVFFLVGLARSSLDEAPLAVPLVGVELGRGLGRRLGSVLGATLAAGALTALLGAIQLVPALFATRESVRAAGMTYEGATVFSLHPAELVGLLVPFAFGAQAAPETAWFEAFAHERAWSEVLYVGPIALGLALLALGPRSQGRRVRDDPLARGGVAVFVVFLLLALGRWTPLYQVFFRLPVAGLFRYPAKLLLHASLGLALLAGAGAEALARDVSGGVRRQALVLFSVFAGLALLASNGLRVLGESAASGIDQLGSTEIDGKAAVGALAWRLAHVAFVALGGVALVQGSRVKFLKSVAGLRLTSPSPARLVFGLAALVLVDLTLACRPALIFAPADEVHRAPAVAALLAREAETTGVPARVAPTRLARRETPGDVAEARARADAGGFGMLRDEGLLPNRGIAQGVLSQSGFLSNEPLRISVLEELVDQLSGAVPAGSGGWSPRLTPAEGAVLRGARYALVRDDEVAAFTNGPSGREASVVGAVPGGRALLRLEGATPPWAAVYARARLVSGIQGGLDALRRKSPLREVALEGVAPDPALEVSEPGSSLVPEARVQLVGAFGAERFELAVETPGRGWLVVRETFAGGWSARVNGEPAAILPADVAFRGVLVPAGSSKVVFEYASPGLTLGALVSALSILASLSLVVLQRRRHGVHR